MAAEEGDRYSLISPVLMEEQELIKKWEIPKKEMGRLLTETELSEWEKAGAIESKQTGEGEKILLLTEEAAKQEIHQDDKKYYKIVFENDKDENKPYVGKLPLGWGQRYHDWEKLKEKWE